MKKIITGFVMLILLTACAGKNPSKTIDLTLKEGEVKEVSVFFDLDEAFYDVNRTGIINLDITGDVFVVEGIKEGNAVVNLYKDKTKKEFLKVNVTVTKKENVECMLKFIVSVPTGVIEVYLSGEFNDWKVNDQDWKLTKIDNAFVLEKTIQVPYVIGEYKYIIDGYWEELSNPRNGGTLLVESTKTFNDEVINIGAPVDGNTILKDYDRDYYATGQFNGWWAHSSFKMEATSIDDERITSIAEQLEGVHSLYILEITLPSEEAMWEQTYTIDGVEVTFNGNLALKVICTEKDDDSLIYYWAQNVESGAITNLTPNTLFIPKYIEENPDGDGTWADNIFAKEAGTYYLVFAEKGAGKNIVRYIGLIKK